MLFLCEKIFDDIFCEGKGGPGIRSTQRGKLNWVQPPRQSLAVLQGAVDGK